MFLQISGKKVCHFIFCFLGIFRPMKQSTIDLMALGQMADLHLGLHLGVVCCYPQKLWEEQMSILGWERGAALCFHKPKPYIIINVCIVKE